MERRKVCITIESDFDFEGSVDDVCAKLKDVIRENEGKYDSIRIEKYYWSDNPSYDIEGEREETDEEFQRRSEIDKRDAEEKRQKELRFLAELKAKYEGVTQ